MPTDEENNAATPQYITSNDLIGVKIPTFSWDEPDLPQALKKFRRYCKILLSTPTYSRKTGKEQVSYILLWLGPQGVEIYDSWNLSEADQQDTKKVWDAFSAYFEPKSNFRLSRYQVRNIKQEEKEAVDNFVRRLKTHSQKCKFPPEYVDNHLIDQFIVGVAHDSVRKTILDKDPSKVTLDDCIQYACMHEATDRQFHCFQGQDQHMVACIWKTPKRQHPRQQTKPKSTLSRSGPCIFCGGSAHKSDKCKVQESQCNYCHKIGHWENACLQKQRTMHKGSKQKSAGRQKQK